MTIIPPYDYSEYLEIINGKKEWKKNTPHEVIDSISLLRDDTRENIDVNSDLEDFKLSDEDIQKIKNIKL